MKIIKVIVDELPLYCGDCEYCYPYIFEGDDGLIKTDLFCDLAGMSLMDIDRDIEKPDWCPLVRKDLYEMEIIQNFVGKESDQQ